MLSCSHIISYRSHKAARTVVTLVAWLFDSVTISVSCSVRYVDTASAVSKEE